ncbi:aspartate aminotransferase family protein [Roseococcus sp.]|uniref:aspartate aminotransferase family protein n=1 Tax=Roseococcus sp. TaxID=2109646 RepID=UPI003BA87177
MPQLDTVTAPRNTDLDTALAEARESYVAARPKSAAAYERAKKVMPGGNTRSTLYYSPFPTAMESGEGCYLKDIDGHDYLDLCGEYTAGIFGHSEARIVKAIEGAIGRGLNLAAAGERESVFAAIICARFPSIELVRFTNSGTEANLFAFSAARAFTGRQRLLAMNGGYHGGMMTFAGGGSPVNAPFPVTLAPYNDIEATRALIREHKDELACILIEPMIGAGGCIPASREFLQMLRDEATAHGIVLTFDEVMTSRHSAGGLQKLHGITPDLTTLGKYIAGGMSFGAFGGRADIMGMYDPANPKALPHGGTFNNNVLSMSAGIVAMGEIFTEETSEALRARGDGVRDALNAICAKHKVPVQFTGIGSMLQPHFRSGPVLRPYTQSATEEALRELFFLDLMAAGIYIARRGMVAMSLPVGDAECARYLGVVEAFCAARKPLLGEG